ncbi:PAS domain S-box-containing protein/diguanylate cyclase (GGDEF) domain-containing protein, partial [Halarsenatibacter silvermanii]
QYLELFSYPMIEEDTGEVTGIVEFVRDITDRLEAERELKEEKQRFQALAETSPFALFVYREKFQYVNSTLADLTGYTRGELLDMNFWEIVAPEHREMVKERGLARLKGQSPPGMYEFKLQKKNGEELWILFSGVQINYQGEKAAIGTAIDISDRIEAEKQIKQIKEEQEILLENTDVQVWYLKDIETYGRVNQAHADFLGKNKKELENKTLWEIMSTKKEAEVCIEGNREVFDEKRQIETEERVTNGEGEERILSITKTPKMNKKGEVEFVVCSAQDITSEYRLKQQLKQSRDYLKSIVHTVPDIIMLYDKKGNYLDIWTSEIEDLVASKEELIGKNIEEFLPEGVTAKHKKYLTKAIEEEEKQRFEYELIINGNKKCFEAQLIALDNDNNKQEILAVSRNITRRKRAKEKLKYMSYHDNLTDLYNRHFMETEMERLNTKRQHPISLIYCDINGLKIVNDTYGHEVGDELLIKTAEILQKVTRDEDLVARWAGDEFVILLPQADRETAEEVIERIESACKGAEFKDIPITLGIGSAAKKKEETSFETVLNKADERMYKDKLMKSQSAENKLVKNMLATLEAKSAETREHSMRMTELAHKLGNEAGLNSEQVNDL